MQDFCDLIIVNSGYSGPKNLQQSWRSFYPVCLRLSAYYLNSERWMQNPSSHVSVYQISFRPDRRDDGGASGIIVIYCTT